MAPIQLFDQQWTDLEVESVERFLASAGDEGLVWEAKMEVRSAQIQKAVSGFANQIGGYIIVGAQRPLPQEPGWELPGIKITGEPGSWLSQLITPNGVSPIPFFDIKVFPRGDDRHAAVILVEAIATPPCITAAGTVFQRSSGVTNPVTDQTVLMNLIRKGETARFETATRALEAARDVLATPGSEEAGRSFAAVGLCALGGPPDRASVLFQQSRFDKLARLLQWRLSADPVASTSMRTAVYQDQLRAWMIAPITHQCHTAAVYWNGAAAIGFTLASSDERDVSKITRQVTQFWKALVDVLEIYEGAGDAHLAIVFAQPNDPDRAWPRTDARRWTEVRPPSVDELAGVKREIERGFGQEAWEPEERRN